MNGLGHYFVVGLFLIVGWFAGSFFSYGLKAYWRFCARLFFRLPFVLAELIGFAGWLVFLVGVATVEIGLLQVVGIHPGNTLVASLSVGILVSAGKHGLTVIFNAMAMVEEKSETDYREAVAVYQGLGWKELTSFRSRGSGAYLGVMTAKYNEPIPSRERITRGVEEARLEAESAERLAAQAAELTKTEAPPADEAPAPANPAAPAPVSLEYPEVIAEKRKLARDLGKDWLRGVRSFRGQDSKPGIGPACIYWLLATVLYLMAIAFSREDMTPAECAFYYGPIVVLAVPLLFRHWREKRRASAFRPGKLILERQEGPGGGVQGRYLMEKSHREEELVITLWCLRRDAQFQEMDSPIINEKVIWFAQTTGTCGAGKPLAFSFEIPLQAPPHERSLGKDTGHIVAWLLFIKSENPSRPYCEEFFLELPPAPPEKSENAVHAAMPLPVWPQQCRQTCTRFYWREGSSGKPGELILPSKHWLLHNDMAVVLLVPAALQILCSILDLSLFWSTLVIWPAGLWYSIFRLRILLGTIEIRIIAGEIEVLRKSPGRVAREIYPADSAMNDPRLVENGCSYRVVLSTADKTRKMLITLRTPLDSLLLQRHCQRGHEPSDEVLDRVPQPDLTSQKIPMLLKSPEEISRRQASQVMHIFRLFRPEHESR